MMVGLLTDNGLINNGGRMDTVVLGSLLVQPQTSWVIMDTKICDIFKVITLQNNNITFVYAAYSVAV